MMPWNVANMAIYDQPELRAGSLLTFCPVCMKKIDMKCLKPIQAG